MSSPVGQPALRVDVLGPPAMQVDGAPLAVDTRKAVAVLAVLACAASTGRPEVTRAELAALLWPGSDAARARATLRRTLSVLVAAAGAAVLTDRDVVRLGAGVVSDVVTFRGLATSDEREDLARAVGLVRGEFLAGFELRDSPEFDDWSVRTSDELRRELGGVLERLVLARFRHGELHAALADTARWLELDPLHEAAHRSFMRTLAWTGRRQDALDHYARCVRVLDAELGVAPVRATTEVFEAVRDGTLAGPRRGGGSPRPVPPRPAPAPGPGRRSSPEFVGRSDALATLTAARGRPGVVVVTGEAGVGRSRLIEEFAATSGPSIVVRARGSDSGLTFAVVTDLVRAAVAAGPPPPDDVAAEVARIAPELAPPGRAAPGPLSDPGARDRFYDAVVRVLAGSGATAVVVEDVHALSPASAELLAYLAHRTDRLPFPLVLTWREPGLPLRHPVRIALGTVRPEHPITTISLERLTFDDVVTLAGTGADRVWADSAGLPLLVDAALRSGGAQLPDSVRDLLAARLAEVSDEAAEVLVALAAMNGRATPEDLAAVTGRVEDDVVDALDEALGAGLVREEGTAVGFVHSGLRRVAYDGSSALRRRLLHRRTATTWAARPDARQRAGAIAGQYHRSGDDVTAAEWAWTAVRESLALYAHSEALTQLELLASLGPLGVDAELATGDASVALARYDDAAAAYARAARLAERPATTADVERRLADVAVRRGEWAAAAAHLDRAAAAVTDDADLAARLRSDRAVVAVRAGDLALAATLVDPEATDPYALDVAGIVALADGRRPAVPLFRRALAASPDPVLRAAIVNNLAQALAGDGDEVAAVEAARDALALGERLGDRHRLAALHANLADRLHAVGTVDGSAEAEEHLTASARLFAEVDADPLSRPDVWTLTSW